MAEPLYDDTYTGPRWRYGLQHRPISNYFIGRGGSGDLPHPILFSHRESPDPRFPHGEADWPVELAPVVASHHSLVLVDEDDEWGEVTSMYDDDDQALDSDPYDVDRDEYAPGGRYFD